MECKNIMKLLLKTITKEQIDNIIFLHESVKGTRDYNKYTMQIESKSKYNDKWGKWVFLGWGVPYVSELTVKKVKDTVYLMYSGIDGGGYESITRYAVTDTINDVLKIWEE